MTEDKKLQYSTFTFNIFSHIFTFNSRITAKIDDDMISFYCNEDLFLLEVRQADDDLYDITLTELPNH